MLYFDYFPVNAIFKNFCFIYETDKLIKKNKLCKRKSMKSIFKKSQLDYS